MFRVVALAEAEHGAGETAGHAFGTSRSSPSRAAKPVAS